MRNKFILGFLLCALAVVTMAQITPPPGGGGGSASTFNGTQFSSDGAVTNIADGVILTNVVLRGNLTLPVIAAPATNVVDLSTASATNILNAALTILHATNGVTAYEQTHVRWFWAGGADRALTIPVAWKTNAHSAVPANITNGWITKMYVTSIGDTGSSANQSNVFVSFEYYQ